MSFYLGIEFGSTRIKAVTIDEEFKMAQSSDYVWKSEIKNGIWTYDLLEALKGLKTVLAGIKNRQEVKAVGISGMMHGYLAFDKDWNLLAPFRTWQNTITGALLICIRRCLIKRSISARLPILPLLQVTFIIYSRELTPWALVRLREFFPLTVTSVVITKL